MKRAKKAAFSPEERAKYRTREEKQKRILARREALSPEERARRDKYKQEKRAMFRAKARSHKVQNHSDQMQYAERREGWRNGSLRGIRCNTGTFDV